MPVPSISKVKSASTAAGKLEERLAKVAEEFGDSALGRAVGDAAGHMRVVRALLSFAVNEVSGKE